MNEFEWDDAKSNANLLKHGLDFADAALMFRGPHFTYRSTVGREERLVSVGSVNGVVIAVVWVMRGWEKCRIISARRARRYERERYHQDSG